MLVAWVGYPWTPQVVGLCNDVTTDPVSAFGRSYTRQRRIFVVCPRPVEPKTPINSCQSTTSKTTITSSPGTTRRETIIHRLCPSFHVLFSSALVLVFNIVHILLLLLFKESTEYHGLARIYIAFSPRPPCFCVYAALVLPVVYRGLDGAAATPTCNMEKNNVSSLSPRSWSSFHRIAFEA